MNKVKDTIMKWRIEREIRRIAKKLEEARQNSPKDDLEIFDIDGIFADDKELDIPVDDDTENEELTELVEAIASFAAERAADNFTDAVNGMRVNVIAEMIRMIGQGDSESGLRMLRGMLYARGMKEAAKELDIIEMCEDYCEDVYDMFIADFMHNEEITIGIWLSTRRNYRRGEEHGSAKWGDARAVNRKYRQKPVDMNKILTQNVMIGFDGHKHRRNLNVLVIGGSGAGKTRFFVKPNVMQDNCSKVILDPKGEILRATGWLLIKIPIREEGGYDRKRLSWQTVRISGRDRQS